MKNFKNAKNELIAIIQGYIDTYKDYKGLFGTGLFNKQNGVQKAIQLLDKVKNIHDENKAIYHLILIAHSHQTGSVLKGKIENWIYNVFDIKKPVFGDPTSKGAVFLYAGMIKTAKQNTAINTIELH